MPRVIATDPSDQGWTPTRGGRRRSPRRRPDFEYRSTRTVWGLPLIHIAHDAGGERMALARGIVAIGDMAVGLVANRRVRLRRRHLWGGGMNVGVISLGGLAAGLLLAIGGMAFGGFAVGALAFGVVATGATAGSMLDLSTQTMQWASLAAWALATAVVTAIVAGLIVWWRDAEDGESPMERDDAERKRER